MDGKGEFVKFFTTVTPFSKLLAASLFITLPFIGFYLGVSYQKLICSTLKLDPEVTASGFVKKIAIWDGNVYQLLSTGTRQLLVEKDDFSTDSGEYVPPIQFTSATVSPDQNKVMLFAHQGVSSDALFYTNINQVSPKYIHIATQALWSNSSRYIAYVSKIADAGGTYYLGIYDTDANVNLILSSKVPSNQATKMYSVKSWQKDDSGILVHYQTQSEIPYGEVIDEGDEIISISKFTPEK